jgi:hypothetical protein
MMSLCSKNNGLWLALFHGLVYYLRISCLILMLRNVGHYFIFAPISLRSRSLVG